MSHSKRAALLEVMQTIGAGLGGQILRITAVSIVKQVVLDLGRKPEARFAGAVGGEYLRDEEVSQSLSVRQDLPSWCNLLVHRHSTLAQHSSDVALGHDCCITLRY